MSARDLPPGFTFPAPYTVKAMGLAGPDFVDLVLGLLQPHCAPIAPTAVRSRPSRNGKYLSVSVTIEATGFAQLDAIYADLTAHERILMRL